MNWLVRALMTVILTSLAGHASADELRPGYLDLRERAQDEFIVLWKIPALGDLRQAL